jgi:hypothetical protein
MVWLLVLVALEAVQQEQLTLQVVLLALLQVEGTLHQLTD